MATEETTGAGGKFRRKPWRRSHTTPYDRPTTSLRPTQVFGGEREKNTWFSKLLDPASRLITSGAHKLFSSVFRKRLLPPPPPQHHSDEKMEIGDVQPAATAMVGPSGTKEPVACRGYDLRKVSDGGRVAELEDILKKKTFSRSEVDHLTGLLLSRTVDASVGAEIGRLEPKVSDEKAVHSRCEIQTNPRPIGNGTKRVLPAAIATPDVRSKVLEDVVASPAELAKAYMGSRPARASPLMLESQNEMPREDLSAPFNPYFKPKSPTIPLIQKSSHDIGSSSNGFMTPRFRGRSAIYSMARTPYSRPHPTDVYKVAESASDIHGASTSSHNTKEMQQLSGSKRQVLKRRSSVLESDIGSVGPIRRIRQKPNLLNHKTLCLPASGRSHVKHGSGALKNVTEMPSSIDWSPNHRSSSKALADNGMPSTSNGYVPSQSIETAQKIFQQLDKFTSKGKTPEKQIDIVRGGSPGKISTDMRDGLAHKSMNSVDSLKVFQNIEGSRKQNGLLDSINAHDHSPKISPRLEEGSRKRSVTPSGEDGAEAGSPIDGPVYVTPPSNFNHQQKKRAFQMSAHEDYLELDDDVNTNGVASTPMIKGMEGHEMANSSAAFSDNPCESAAVSAEKLSTPQSQPLTNSLGTKKELSLPDGSATGFTLPGVQITPSASSMGTQAAASSPRSTAETDKVAGQSEKNYETTASNSNSAKMAPFSFSPSSTTESAVAKDLEPVFPSSATESPAKADGADKTAKKSTFVFGDVSKKVEDSPVVSPAKGLFSFGLQSNGATLSNGLPGTISVSMGLSSSAHKSSSSNGLSSIPVSLSSSPVPCFSNGSLVSSSTVATAAGTTTIPANAGGMFTFGSSSTQSSTSVTAPSASFGSSSQFGSPTVGSTFATVATSASEFAANSEAKSNEAAFGNASSGLFSAKPSGTAVGTDLSGFNASTFKIASSETQTAAPAVASGSIFGFQASSSAIPVSASTQNFSGQSASSASSPLSGLSPPTSFNAVAPMFGSASTVTFPFTSGSVSATNASGSSSVTAPVSSSINTPGIFGWPATKPTVPGSIFGTSSQSTGFSFGSTASGTSTSTNSVPIVFGATSSASAATNSAPFVFGSGSPAASAFSVPPAAGSTPAASTPCSSQLAFSSSSSQPFAFGSTPSVGNNDQMSMEDSMAEDSMQVPTPVAPVFGAPNPAPSSGFVFGGAAPSTGNPFQFGNQQNQIGSQNTPFGNQQNQIGSQNTPFQPSGSLEFNANGSFSLGSGNVDKSNRRIVKIKNRTRRK